MPDTSVYSFKLFCKLFFILTYSFTYLLVTLQADEDRDTEEDQGVLGRPSIWVGQHTIW